MGKKRFFDFMRREDDAPPGGYDALEAKTETSTVSRSTAWLDDPDIAEWLGLRKMREPLTEVTYLTCLKMLSFPTAF